MGKKLWIIGGTISLGLGIVGIILPVLPTTPFLLLAAFCYGRGSEGFYQWLVYRSPFGSHIRDYRDGKGVPLRQKLITLTLLWLTIGATILFILESGWLKALLFVIAIGVTTHLSRVKNRLPESAALTTAPPRQGSVE